MQFSFTPEGKNYYDKLGVLEKSEFLNQLKTQLSSIVPISPDRLDNIQPFKSSLFTMLIKSTKDLSEKNSDGILKDLDILIKNGETTLISQLNTTKFIDYGYGLQVSGKYISLFLLIFLLY